MTPALDLAFRAGPDGRTVLASRRVRHPFSVQAPLWDLPERPRCARLFIQSISGGIFADEEIGQRVRVRADAELRVEMPAAMVVHAMKDGAASRQWIELAAEANARLEFLPRPLILFPTSRLSQNIRIEADPSARLLVGDGFMMHDPYRSGDAFAWFDSTIRLSWPDGRLIALDRARASGLAMLARLPGVTGRHAATGSLWMVRPIDEITAQAFCREIQALLDGEPGVFAGATPLRHGGGVLVRILAEDGGALVEAQAAVLPLLRHMLQA